MKKEPRTYECLISRAVDGDTFEVSVDLGFKINLLTTIRIYGINSEEMHDKDPKKRKEAQAAKDFAKSFEGKPGAITVITEDKYGRHVARLEVDGKSYGDEIVNKGLAKEAVYTLADSEFEYEFSKKDEVPSAAC